jgi:F-type H+-transporting ATPase subunit alpha
VPAQIAVLLALSEKLFDSVPIEQMRDAEHALLDAATGIPAEICARFETDAKLSDEDRKAVVQIARQAVENFQTKPKPDSKPDSKPESKPESEPESEPESKPESVLKEHS